MTTGPGYEMPAVAGRGHLRASHADRERVIDVLKAAFVAGRLTKDELEARVGHTLAARTFADLAALTADIPAGLPAGQPRRTPAWPRVRTAVKFGVCLAVGPAVLVGAYFTKSDNLAKELFTFVIIYYMILMVAGVMVLDSWHQKRYRGQPPPRPVRRGPASGGGPDGGRGDGPTRCEPRGKARAHRPPDRSLAQRSRHIPAVRKGRGWPANLQATGQLGAPSGA